MNFLFGKKTSKRIAAFATKLANAYTAKLNPLQSSAAACSKFNKLI